MFELGNLLQFLFNLVFLQYIFCVQNFILPGLKTILKYMRVLF